MFTVYQPSYTLQSPTLPHRRSNCLPNSTTVPGGLSHDLTLFPAFIDTSLKTPQGTETPYPQTRSHIHTIRVFLKPKTPKMNLALVSNTFFYRFELDWEKQCFSKCSFHRNVFELLIVMGTIGKDCDWISGYKHYVFMTAR